MNTPNLELAIGSEATAEKHIELRIADQTGRTVEVWFDVIWQEAELKEWLSQNRELILSENLPVFSPKASCIAESIACFYDRETDPSGAELDAMYAYRTRHGFRFAMRGLNIPDIYVGLFDSRYQISVMRNGRPSFSFVTVDPMFG